MRFVQDASNGRADTGMSLFANMAFLNFMTGLILDTNHIFGAVTGEDDKDIQYFTEFTF